MASRSPYALSFADTPINAFFDGGGVAVASIRSNASTVLPELRGLESLGTPRPNLRHGFAPFDFVGNARGDDGVEGGQVFAGVLVACKQKIWMFYGSDTCAESAAANFSLEASCRLRSIDPQQYLDEVMRVLPLLAKERYLELAPKYWTVTRSHLNPIELDTWLCPFTVPPAALNFAR